MGRKIGLELDSSFESQSAFWRVFQQCDLTAFIALLDKSSVTLLLSKPAE